MNILLTGARGFLGSNIAKKLGKKNKIIKTDIRNLNITKKRDVNKYFAKYKFDLVIHCAAAKGAIDSFKRPKFFYNTNFNGTLNILKMMRKYDCKKIIFISTSGLYKNGVNKKNEYSKIFCKNPYAKAKYLSERLIKYYCDTHNFDGLCIRPNLISGYGLFKDNLIYDVVRGIKKNKKAVVFGNGNHIREFTHPDDISDFILLMIKKKFKGFSVFNISNNKIRIITLIKKIIFFMNKGKINFFKNEKKTFSLILNNTKILKTGWKPKRSINYIIKEIVTGVKNEK